MSWKENMCRNLYRITVIVLSILFASIISVQATEEYQDGDFVYMVVDGGIVITGYNGNSDIVDIPNQIAGLPVYRIESGAFIETNIKTINLPETIMSIGTNALPRGVEVVYEMDETEQSVVVGELVLGNSEVQANRNDGEKVDQNVDEDEEDKEEKTEDNIVHKEDIVSNDGSEDVGAIIEEEAFLDNSEITPEMQRGDEAIFSWEGILELCICLAAVGIVAAVLLPAMIKKRKGGEVDEEV